MNKLKEISKIKIIGILIILISLAIGSIYYFNQEKELTLCFKNDKNITIEYGKTVDMNFDDFIDIKDYSKEEIKKLKEETEISTNIENEEGKEYPAIGKYVIQFKYQDQKINKKVIVKDTTKPVFNDTNEISLTTGTQNYDYSSTVEATDLSPIEIHFDASNVHVEKAGDYKLIATAKDTSGNTETKEITVHIKNKTVSSSNVQGIVYQGKGKVVCIDAGHQASGNSEKEPNGPGSSVMKAKVTTGATGCVTGARESQINLEVAIKLQKILTSRGYKVVMCRTSQNVNISNAQRAQIANDAQAAAFVRIHCDSSDSSSPTGTMTMAPSTSNRYCASIASQSQALSRAVLKNTCAMTGSKSRGVSITDTMTGLNWSQVPVTIIEMGFLSNPTEDRLLNDSSYQDKLALGIANGIGEYLGN